MRGYGGQRGYHPYMQQQPSGFGNLTYTETVPEFFGNPVEDYQRVSSELYQRGEQNRLAFEELQLAAELDMQKVQSHDRENILQSISRVQDSISTYVEGGNFHNANKALTRTYREYITDDLRNASIQSMERLQQNIASIDEMELPKHYADAAKAKAQSHLYNAPVRRDPETGEIVGGFQGYTPAKYVNADALVKEFMSNSGWQNRGFITEGYDWSTLGQQDYVMGREYGEKGVGHDEVASAIAVMLSGNEEYQAWLRTKYELDNFDPTSPTGIAAINENQIAVSLPVTRYDDKGKPIPLQNQLTEGQLALDHMVQTIQEDHRVMNNGESEISREQALEKIRFNQFKNDEMYNVIYGIGETLAGKFITDKQKSIKDHAYARRRELSLKSVVDAHYIGAGDVSININNLRSEIESFDESIRQIDNNLRGLKTNLDSQTDPNKIQNIQSQIETLNVERKRYESAKQTAQRTFTNLTDSVSDEDIRDMLERGLKPRGNRSFRDLLKYFSEDELFDIVKNNQLDKVKEVVENLHTDLDKQELIPTNLWIIRNNLIARGINELDKGFRKSWIDSQFRTLDEDISTMYDNIDRDKLNYYQNYITLSPEGNHMARQQESLERRLRQGLPFETIDGRSSASDNFVEMIPEDSELTFSFVGDKSNGEMVGMVTYSNGKDKPFSVMIRTPQLEGATVGNWRDVAAAAMSEEYKRHPEMANNLWQLGTGGLAGLESTYNSTGTSRTGVDLRTASRALRVEGYNVGRNTTKDPIVLKRGGKDIILAYEKTRDGIKVLVNYTGQEDDWTDGLGFTVPNVDAALPHIYNMLETTESVHNNYIYGF